METVGQLTTYVTLFITGGGLGVFFFGGLWLTLKGMMNTDRVAELLITSFVVRAGVVVAGLHWLTVWRWDLLLCALAGLWLARRLCFPACRREQDVSAG